MAIPACAESVSAVSAGLEGTLLYRGHECCLALACWAVVSCVECALSDVCVVALSDRRRASLVGRATYAIWTCLVQLSRAGVAHKVWVTASSVTVTGSQF